MGRKFWGLYVIKWGIATFGVKSVVRKKIFWGNFLPKIRHFRDFELLVLRNPSTTQNFVKIVQGPAGISRLWGAEMWEYSPQNCQNFEFLPYICFSWATRFHFFNEIHSMCTRL